MALRTKPQMGNLFISYLLKGKTHKKGIFTMNLRRKWMRILYRNFEDFKDMIENQGLVDKIWMIKLNIKPWEIDIRVKNSIEYVS